MSSSSAKSTPFYFGGVASCAAAMVSHPFDLAKVRLQTATGASRSGMLKTMFTIVTQEGPTALYAGLSASLLRQATYSTVRFGVYDKLKTAMTTGNQKPGFVQMLACSSIAGALGGACGNPGDVVNVRMQNDGQLPAAQRRNYRNALDGVIRISREEGIASLMRGVGPNVNRAILMTGSQLVSYDVFKDLLLNNVGLSDGMGVHFGSSLLAGLVATTVCSPVDVIKTRIMSASSAQGVGAVSAMKDMIRSEGILSLFKGWTPAFIRLGPHTIVTFMVLEQLKQWHQAFYSQKSATVAINKA
ncbi:mitochondrial carrier domain-containing protein [Umbelopsis sp. AD052]|nr:mitochondrial carrier domain-containing protein [Umbelopsis sp. AD052]